MYGNINKKSKQLAENWKKEKERQRKSVKTKRKKKERKKNNFFINISIFQDDKKSSFGNSEDKDDQRNGNISST